MTRTGTPRPARSRGGRSRGTARVAGLLVVALLSVLTVVPAYADPIPGASYNGTAADGATVALTVSSDGTIVSSYRVVDAKGNTCDFYGAGVDGQWAGAPITDGAFLYQFYSAILFQGTFPGPQSAAGTFRFYDAPQGGKPACDTGTVSWTATTTATPPAGTGAGPTGGGGAGGQGNPRGGKHAFTTRVALHTLSRTRLGGRLSSNPVCRAGRTVILWRGRRRIESVRSKANGTYAFTRPALWRGRVVRATASPRNLKGGAGTCAAGSSTFIRA